MKKLLALKSVLRLLITVLLISSSALAAEKTETWQLSLEYDQSSLRALNASVCQGATKKVVTPGVNGAPAKIDYNVEWLDQSGAVIFITETKLPLGTISTFTEGEPCTRRISQSGFVTLRLEGPELNSNPSAIRLSRPSTQRSSGFGEPLPNLFTQNTLLVPIVTLGARAFEPEGPVSSLKIRDVGPDDNRLVFVIMGDGYTAANLANGDFDADVQTVIAAFIGRAPWDVLFDAVNIYQISVESNEEGSDNDPLGTTVDTYLHSSFWVAGIERLLALEGPGYGRAVAAADAFVGVGMWDELVVVVNSTKYGGSGGSISVISVNGAAPEVLLHEIGHTFAGLADEYDYGGSAPPTSTTEPNSDLNYNPPKWEEWILPTTPLPTPVQGNDTLVGAFEGGAYYPTGSYRPWVDCLMRSLGRELDPVCKEAHVLELANRLSLVDDFSFNAAPILIDTFNTVFSSTPLTLPGLSFQWKVNGLTPTCGVEPVYQVSSTELPNFVNDVQLIVEFPTLLVRQDTIVDTIFWIAIMDCNGNGINDSLDILGGTPDLNSNGIIDACESSGCCVTPGDADGSGSTNVGDVTFLIVRIFNSGPAPICSEEGDADANGSVNIADVTFLIARIFGGGPAPQCLSMGSGNSEWTGLPCALPQDIYAIWGLADDDIFAVGDAGLILHYDGFGWEPRLGGQGNQLIALWGTAADNIYAVGISDGVLLHYNGVGWNLEPNASTSNLFGIWGSAPDDVFMVGFNMVQHFDGSSWSVSHPESFAFLTGVWGAGAIDVYVVGFGGKMLHYDGAWTTLPTVTNKDLNAIWGSGPNDIFSVGATGTILHSAGGAWTSMFTGVTSDLNCIWGTSGDDVYAAGDNGVILHYNGTIWQPMQNSGTADLQGIWGANSNLQSVGKTGTILKLEN